MLAYRNRGISENEGRKEGACSPSPTFKSHRLDSKVKLDEWVPWVCAPQKTCRPRKRPRCPRRKCRLLRGQAARLGLRSEKNNAYSVISTNGGTLKRHTQFSCA